MDELKVPVNSRDHIRGSENAPVTLLEYGDYECPFCGRAHFIVEEVRDELGNSLRFVFRNFPLVEVHPHALTAAHAAEAAGLQGKFWEMHDILFENQEALDTGDILIYAQELDLDIKKFVRNLESEEVAQKVRDDLASGEQSGVMSTPTFFINGRKHVGSYEFADLLAAIQQEVGVE
jgi:protein-disulfide isomerase